MLPAHRMGIRLRVPTFWLGAVGILFWFAFGANAAADRSGGLRNGDFESSAALQSWDLNVYGARPELTIDPQVRHAGKQSLCIKAEEPSDTALGQEIQLSPNALYGLSGWVKTQGLAATTARVLGTLQVQHQSGRGTIVSGPNHSGNTDWTEVVIGFRAPPDGRVRICLFFAGFGKAIGTAWFSGLTLEGLQAEVQPLVVTREPISSATISRFQYGQFIEYLCNLVPGMWAERLYDNSFEGLSPYQFEFIKQTDFKEKPWYPSGEVNRATYSLDRSTKISGDQSQKIEVAPGAPCRVGLSQDGIFVDPNESCEFQAWWKADGIQEPVRVKLHHGPVVYAQSEFQPGQQWQKFGARLVASRRDDNATLTIEFQGPGTLWLDDISLLPIRTVGGWRPDVVAALRDLRPGIIRLGGNAVEDTYEWKDTVGDPDRRRPFRAWGGLQPTGPGLEEIVQLCQAVEAEPLICVRTLGRTAADAAEEVEYLNGSTATAMGAWRARNGHPAPYGIKYWQVGNERSGREYQQQLADFCAAMKKADPSIKLLSSFPTPTLLRQAGQWLDYVAPHQYSQDLWGMENELINLEQMIREFGAGKTIKVAVTEWNTTAGDAGPRRAMLWSLANALACSRYHNLLHRHCDLVEIANRSNLANSFCSGIIQTDNHRLFKTPTYYAQQLYSTLAGTTPLKIQSSIPAGADIDVSATLSAESRELTLFAVNDSLVPVVRPLDLSAFDLHSSEASVWTLGDTEHAGEPDAANSFDHPERIRPVRSQFRIKSARYDYQFPALTLTVIRCALR